PFLTTSRTPFWRRPKGCSQRWLSGWKQRFAKTKTTFRPRSSPLILSLQFQSGEAITPNRLSSRVLLSRLISCRRLTFLTYLFRAPQTPFEVQKLSRLELGASRDRTRGTVSPCCVFR